MSKVRMGIVGIGNIGTMHVTNLLAKKVKGLTLNAVCDIDQSRLDWVKGNDPDVTIFTDYKAMIDSGEIDSVLIAVPHYLHPVIAVYAFEKGLHVLCEKPAGVYTKKVEEMNAAAEASGKVFSLMYNQRTSPIYKKVKSMIESGQLGQLKRFVWIITNWYRPQCYYDSGTWRATWSGEGGGVLINQCPHNLDIWQWLFGMPVRVRGFCDYGKFHDIEVEDNVTAYAEYANGANAVFITTTGETPGTNRLEISGDKGKIVIEDGKLKFWETAVPEREFCRTTEGSFSQPDVTFYDIPISEPETAHVGIMQNFANAITSGEALIAPGCEGINGLTVSNAIHLSDWTDNWVNLPIDGDLYYKLLGERAEKSRLKTSAEGAVSDMSGTFNS